MKLAVTHNPFAEALRKSATDRLFELAGVVGKRLRRLGVTPGWRLEIDNRGTAFNVMLSAVEGSKSAKLEPTGCYVSCTVHAEGLKKVLRVSVHTKVNGPFADTINRRAGVTELHEIATLLDRETRGFEFAD